MEAINFKLEAFEGPLDVLLHLVSKHKLNIYDIEISLLLEQYLEFINNAEKLDYELAADFFEMAARLIYIKTCYLLPRPEEAEELKKELQGRMIEYSLCKQAAQRLREMYAGGTVFVREPVKLPVNKQYSRQHDKQVLYDAYMAIFSKVKNYTPLRANLFSPIISKKIVSVESKITYVLQMLYSDGRFDMSALYDGITDRSERIATFLAVLELAKTGNIYISEDNSEISLRTDKPDDEDELSEEVPAPAEEAVEETSEEPQPQELSEAEEASDFIRTEEDEPVPGGDVSDESRDAPAVIPEDTPAETGDDAENIGTADDEPTDAPVKAEEVTESIYDNNEPADAESKASDDDIQGDEAAEPPRFRTWSVQLALETHTASLRLPYSEAVPASAPIALPEDTADITETEPEQPVLTAEETVQTEEPAVAVEEVIVTAEPEAINATDKEPDEAPAAPLPEETPAEELPAADETLNFSPNYFGRRYYWGTSPAASLRGSYRAALLLRI